MWRNHPFNERNKTTERAVGVGVGGDRKRGGGGGSTSLPTAVYKLNVRLRGHPFMTSIKKTNFSIFEPHPPISRKIMFENNNICKLVSNFKTPTPSLPGGRHKFMIP